MTISKHIHALREHLASLGLQPVPDVNDESQPEVFKVCFLNKYEMQRWKELREQQTSETNHTILQGLPSKKEAC
ncbi:hypothetical protein [Chitinophaga nivalis]|uniref:Uncharacterized protein n=1 Tax=Chitinophaga nivalis TaxID=2991709 RepID=A0ABT3IVN6_9BACT|nr:hypothetical protein [Chitinophaga nivalis]MCW3462265.1 hypothetical protein [Chitinophaga nivalis]MCW3488043.1 hypothetical protein [Chitinophaga nivalis]